MSEKPVIELIFRAASLLKGRMFRNNVGMGWVGKVIRLKDGSIKILHPRPLHAGLCVGASDTIGWTPIVITPEMVGKKVAVFTACEVKTGRLKTTTDQDNFLTVLRNSGGIAIVARSDKDFKDGISTWIEGLTLRV